MGDAQRIADVRHCNEGQMRKKKKNRQQNAFNLMRKSVCGFNLYNSFRAVCVCVRRGELF